MNVEARERGSMPRALATFFFAWAAIALAAPPRLLAQHADAGVAPPSADASAPEAAPDAGAPVEAPPTDEGPLDEGPLDEGPYEGPLDEGPLDVDAAAVPDAALANDESGEILVVGTRLSQTAGSAHVMEEEQLQRQGYDDPHAALASVPGVYTRGEDGVGLRPNIGLRGANPDRSKKVTLMEDGVLFGPAPYSAPAAYYFPIMSRMSGMRVIKGPGAIGFGPQTVGGAIDFVTRSVPGQTEGAVDIAFGEYLYRKVHAHAGSGEGPIGVLVEGVHLASDGFKELPDGSDTGFYRNEWMVKGSYEVDEDNELRLKLTYSDEESNETYLGLSDADFRADPLQRYEPSKLDRMRNHRISGVLTHTLYIGDDATLDSDLYRHDFHRVWRKVNRFGGADLFEVLTEPETPRNAVFQSLLRGESESVGAADTLFIGPNERDFASQGVQTRLRWELSDEPITQNLEVGLRLHNDRIERRHSEEGFEIVNGDLFPDGGPSTVTAFNEASSHALALHVIDAVTWQDLTLTPGIRFEAIRSSFDDRIADTSNDRWAHGILPGVGAYYAFTENFGVLAGVYRGFSPPAPGTDDDIEPELSINYEAGARFDRASVHAEVIGFFNAYSNLTNICTFSSGCLAADVDSQLDAGSAHIYGLEAYATVAPEVGAFTVPALLAYTLTRTEFRTSFESDDPVFGDVAKGDEMPYVPRHQIRASLGLDHELGGGDVSVTSVSRTRELPGLGSLDDTLATDHIFLLDMVARLRLIDPFEFYVHVRNLLDAHDLVSRRPFGARPNAPRWIQVGAKASF